MPDTEANEVEPRCGFGVCIPTPGVPVSERCCGAASGMKSICMPNFLGPCANLFKRKVEPAPFYGKDAKPSFLIIMLMGLQHMLAMLVGVITPPRLLANEGCLLNRDSDLCALTPNLICSALLASGILTIMQIARVKLCGGYYFGTGLVSVMGPSFTFLPIGQQMMQEATLDFTGTNGTGLEWYGKFIGTCMVASLFEIIISFLPPKFIKRICPPIVSGVVVFCIGAALTQTGFKYWGGGVFCSQNVMSKPLEGAMNGNRFIMGPHSCMSDNGGERQNPPASDGAIRSGFAPGGIAGYDAPFGDPVYVGYGALAVLIFTFIALFGSPFMKSCNIAISFLTTYAISAGFRGPSYMAFPGAVPHDSMLVTGMFSALTSTQTPVSFLWAGISSAPGFSIDFAPEYFLPILICFFVSTAESIGDITATAKASNLEADDPSIPSRIQGGLLADGVNSFLAALALTPPNTTFSQNTGVISMTNCASRAAGFACCFWLIAAGLFVPFGAFLADAPTCVLGGIVTILFASIMVSGIKIIGVAAGNSYRNQVILSMSLGIALGVSTVPHMFDGGGNSAFYGSVLKMNTGAFPLRATCVPGTEVYFSDTWGGAGTSTGSDPNRANAFGNYFGSTSLSNPPRGMINTTEGFHRGKYLMNPNDWVQSCTIDRSKRAWRTSFLVLINTPYAIGLIVAMTLNLLLPEDADPIESSSTVKAAQVIESGSA